MKKHIISYLSLSVVTLGALAAVALSSNSKDNNFKNNDEVIYLNKQNLVGEAVEDSTSKFASSKTFAFYDKLANENQSLRFATAIKGEIDSISYMMSKVGNYEEKLESVTKVYRGLEVAGNTFYYDGETLTTNESAQGKYYWAVFNIVYADTTSVKEDDVINMQITINGEETTFSSSLTQSKLGGGDGSETNPYLIYSQEGWNEFVANYANYNDKCISLNFSKLAVDTPFSEFKGTFNGNGNSIRLNINKESTVNTAMFSSTTDTAVIKNLIIDEESKVTGGNNTAAFVGTNYGTIENCINNGTIESNEGRAGGIAGYSCDGSKITNCTNNGDVSGKSGTDTTASNILGVGGIVGMVEMLSKSASATVTVESCNNNGDITNTGPSVGGIIGTIRVNGFELNNCNNSGNITGDDILVGGIVGLVNFSNVTISNCTNKSSAVVDGKSYVGGIAGSFGYDGNRDSTISNCTNEGKVTASTLDSKGGYRVGGITGMAYGTTIESCVNSGTIKGGDNVASSDSGDKNIYVGTLVGYLTSKATINK